VTPSPPQLIGAFWHCSPTPFTFKYDPNDPRLLCRELSSLQSHIKPIVSPYISKLNTQIEPYYKPVQPYYYQAIKTSKPYYKRAKVQGTKYWKKQVEPFRKKVVKRGRNYLDPHLKEVEMQYGRHVQPHLDSEWKGFGRRMKRGSWKANQPFRIVFVSSALADFRKTVQPYQEV